MIAEYDKMLAQPEVAGLSEKIYKSACPYNCFDCCSFNVYVKNGKVVKITANPEADFTGDSFAKRDRHT